MNINVNYAKKLSVLGDRISEITSRFSNLGIEINDAKTIKSSYDIYLKNISEYKKCKLNLLDIVPPDKVKKEHKEMVDAFQMFIDGTESMYKAIDIDNLLIDKDMTVKGILLQKKGEEKIVQITNKISKILSE